MTAKSPLPPSSSVDGRVAEIDRKLIIATNTRQLYEFSDGKWNESLVGVNIRSLMKCDEKGYILVRDERSVCRHISEIDSTKVLAMLPDSHQLRYASAIGHKDKIYVVGGEDKASNAVKNIVSVLNVKNNKWMKIKCMSLKRLACSLMIIDDKLFVGGGRGTDLFGSNAIECLDLGAEKWTTLCPTTNEHCQLASVHGKLVAIGGSRYHTLPSSSVEVYDSAANFESWLPLPSMKDKRYGHGACTTEDSTLYVVGGWLHSTVIEYYRKM